MKFGNLVTYSYLCNHKRLKLRKNIEVQTNQGMKTIAQQINWDFETNGDLIIKDKNGKRIYYERSSDGFWSKREHDSQGNEIYYEDSDGYWIKYEYDSRGNTIYWESSGGLWAKCEYDSQGVQIYYENSTGTIVDDRPKPCEGKVVEIEGVKYKLVKA